MGTTLKRRAGIHEGSCSPGSGLRVRYQKGLYVTDGTAIINAQAIGQIVGGASAANVPFFDRSCSNLIITGGGVPANGATVTIAGKVYTWTTSALPLVTDGLVKIAGTGTLSLESMRKAITLTGTPGTDYGSAMTINPGVDAPLGVTGVTLTVVSKAKPKNVELSGGLFLDKGLTVSETMANGFWSQATLVLPRIPLATNRVRWPSTLVANINQNGLGGPVAATLRLRVTGTDQFGNDQVEITPTVTITAVLDNWIYLAKVWSWINSVDYVCNGLDSDGGGGAGSIISFGQRWDWTRTESGAAHHIAGENLGIGLLENLRYRLDGPTSDSTRHRTANLDLWPNEVSASNVLTTGGNPAAAQTVTIDTKVYTFRAVPTLDGEVLVGASEAASIINLAAAITLTGTPGTQYGAAMTKHATVTVTTFTTTTMTVQAIEPGALGNAIATTETLVGSWATATLTGGVSGTVEIMGCNLREITATAANNVSTYLNSNQMEVGRNAVGWNGALEKIAPVKLADVSTWALTDVHHVTVHLRSMDRAP